MGVARPPQENRYDVGDDLNLLVMLATRGVTATTRVGVRSATASRTPAPTAFSVRVFAPKKAGARWRSDSRAVNDRRSELRLYEL